jgi:diguanylate cyclase (GGDEF)-like protein/PAS domain S-box-containing protein
LKEFESTSADKPQADDIFNLVAIGMARVAINGNLLSVNSKLCQILGYSKDELSHLTFQDITHPDDLEPDLEFIHQIIKETRQEYQREIPCLHKNGSSVWINLIVSLVKYSNSHPAYFIAVIEDISVRKNTQIELEKQRRLTDQTINNSMAGIYIYNIKQEKNEFISHAYTDITGYTLDDINQIPSEEFPQLFHQDDRDAVFKHINKVINGADESTSEIEYRFKKKTGGWVWCLSRDKIFSRDAYNQAKSFIGTFIDITRIKNLEIELKTQARVDYLTGADNRRSLNEKLNHEFNRSQRYKRPCSLLMIDIDNFKAINDTYGHSYGDDVLVHLTRIIKQTVRDSDTIARCGGDEFIVILPETVHGEALIMAERIRVEFLKPCNLLHKKNANAITISTGVSTIDKSHPSADALIKSADKALYEAKAAGRNNVK